MKETKTEMVGHFSLLSP